MPRSGSSNGQNRETSKENGCLLTKRAWSPYRIAGVYPKPPIPLAALPGHAKLIGLCWGTPVDPATWVTSYKSKRRSYENAESAIAANIPTGGKRGGTAKKKSRWTKRTRENVTGTAGTIEGIWDFQRDLLATQ